MSTLETICLAVYKSFQACKTSSFQIVYGSKRIVDARVLLVLDSSFNPPHWGHYTLIKKSLQFYSDRSSHVLLMLSVNNADMAPQPALFEKRIEMMCVMADMLKAESINASVGITTHGKYVDKYKTLRESYLPIGTLSFLVGFDTITRIFEPKYYTPHLLSEALNDCMMFSEFCCLTRTGQQSVNDQIDYANRISKGDYEPTIPRSWGKKIHVLVNDKRYENVSSSKIRRDIQNHSSLAILTKELPQPIIKYIQNQAEPIFM